MEFSLYVVILIIPTLKLELVGFILQTGSLDIVPGKFERNLFSHILLANASNV